MAARCPEPKARRKLRAFVVWVLPAVSICALLRREVWQAASLGGEQNHSSRRLRQLAAQEDQAVHNETLNWLPAALKCSQNQGAAQPAAPKAAWYEDVPVDFVFAWFNASDPQRETLYRQYNPGGNYTFGTEPNTGEIYLSLASVFHYAPWVRHIHLVTPPGHRLKLAMLSDALRAKIRMVPEDLIVPPEFYPTFNSIVVEAFLHRIPGLSNHFVYFNDDVLLGKPMPKSLLFSASEPGVGAAFLNDWGSYITEAPPPAFEHLWRYPFYNTLRLLEARFGALRSEAWHAGYAMSKAAYRATWAMFGAELNATAAHRFRTYKPLAEGGSIVAHLLVQHTGIQLGLLQYVEAQDITHLNVVQRARAMASSNVTYLNPDCTRLRGLPEGAFATKPGEGATFVNFNKLQNAQRGVVSRLCAAIANKVGREAFDARVRGCLCVTDEIGSACSLGGPAGEQLAVGASSSSTQAVQAA